MLRLKQLKENEKELLRNINQKYLYEMTRFYPDEMDEQGNYSYGYFDAYFTIYHFSSLPKRALSIRSGENDL